MSVDLQHFRALKELTLSRTVVGSEVRQSTFGTGPSASDVDVRPTRDDVGSGSKNHVQVIAHHRIGNNVYREKTRERFEPQSHPLFAVLEVSSRERIFAAEERSANAACGAMIRRGGPIWSLATISLRGTRAWRNISQA